MKPWLINETKITLVGRVNVGKSTLFNKIAEKTGAIVSNIAGTTRDANESLVSWQGRDFTLIDTGGWQIKPANKIDEQINTQVMNWLTASHLVILLTDATVGPLPEDQAIAQMIKKINCPRLLAVNKTDTRNTKDFIGEWYSLGLGEPIFISGASGQGVGNLLDEITKRTFAKQTKTVEAITVGLIGKPNVGKSSTVNALSYKNPLLVSAEAHTTREPHPVHLKLLGKHWLFIDTAGQRKRSKQTGIIEKTGIKMSQNTARGVDINWLLLDASEPMKTQDKILASELTDTHRGLIIVINKWDLVPNKDTSSQNEMIKKLKANLNTLKWAEIQFISATSKQGLNRLLKKTIAIDAKQNKIFPEKEIEIIWARWLRKHPATRPDAPHKKIKFFSLTQVGASPLTFALRIGVKDKIPAALLNILENELRDRLELTGIPIILKLIRHRL